MALLKYRDTSTFFMKRYEGRKQLSFHFQVSTIKGMT